MFLKLYKEKKIRLIITKNKIYMDLQKTTLDQLNKKLKNKKLTN